MKTKHSWILAALLGVAITGSTGFAADNATPITTPVAKSTQRAAWQERFTLGPGDVVSISMCGVPDSLRTEISIGPDGRITYLQAQDLPAAGLTVDELRKKLDLALETFYVKPCSIITPITYNSKKYVVLGAVANKGVFNFTRPVTVLEAIANAGGIETGLYERTTVELADLSRSMLVRKNARVPVDFEKLFHGDLKQNVPLEPGDYLYFQPMNWNEVYVVGLVNNPGTTTFRPKMTVVRAITARGGFAEGAYKKHVLIVRGSATKPQTILVDTTAVLTGAASDVELQPKDIIYVSDKPWAKAEALLESATRAFVQAVVVTSVSVHITK